MWAASPKSCDQQFLGKNPRFLGEGRRARFTTARLDFRSCISLGLRSFWPQQAFQTGEGVQRRVVKGWRWLPSLDDNDSKSFFKCSDYAEWGWLFSLLTLSLVASVVWIPLSESSFSQFAFKMAKHWSGWLFWLQTFVLKCPIQVSSLSGEGRTQHRKWPYLPVPGNALIWIRPPNMSGPWEINTASVMWTLSCTADIWYPVWDIWVSLYNIFWRVIVTFSCCSTCG